MATKAGRRAGASGRTILVVEAGEGSAETLLAELASRGYPASVLRGERAEKVAGLASDSAEDAESTFSEEQIRLLLGGLSASEIKVLWLLLRNVGNPVSDGDIYRELYGGKGPADSRASEQAVRRLRRKLGPLGASIERQRGVGIRWNPDPGKRAGIAFDRIFRLFSHYRAAVLSFFLVLGFAAGWLLRAGPPARSAPEAELVPARLPAAEAILATEGMVAAPEHGPECAIDGNTNTWFQTAGPARKRDSLLVLYRPPVRGRLDVRCGIPGSTNALPTVRVGVQYSDDEQQRLGFVDPETGAFSCDLREKPVYKVFVVVAADSDEPFAVQSVTIEP